MKNTVVILLLIATVFLFFNLGGRPLEQDEALTAIFAKRVLQFGLPMAYDGKNIILSTNKDYSREGSVWTDSSWMQFYLTAFSFLLLGVGNVAARVPFAIFGLLTIGLNYYFCARYLNDRRVAIVATLLLVFSISFILHMRSCRYFALSSFFTLALVDAYLRMQNEQKFSAIYFVFFTVCLFHTNYGTFVPIMIGLFIHFLIFGLYRNSLRRWVISFYAIAILVFPWMVYLRVWQRVACTFNIYAFFGHLLRYSFYINDWFFPLVLFLPFLGMLLRLKKQSSLLGLDKSRICLLLLLILSTVIILSGYNKVYLRYLIHLVPLFSILLAIVLVKIIKRSKLVGWFIIALLVFTNLLSTIPYTLLFYLPFKCSRLESKAVSSKPAAIAKVLKQEYYQSGEDMTQRLKRVDDFIRQKSFGLKSHLYLFLFELNTEVGENTLPVVRYLNAHAAPEDTLYTNALCSQMIFYTDLKVERKLSIAIGELKVPQWVLIDMVDKDHSHYQLLWDIVASSDFKRVIDYQKEDQWFDRPGIGYPSLSLQKEWQHLILCQLEGKR